jgi:hypothetical protein
MQLFEQPEIRDIIEKYIGSDPVKLALKLKLPREEREAVCEQIKMLQRAADKLPEHFKARCWLPQRAFEQSTSEAVAAAKFSEKGRLAFDLTCGLGVDTMALARNFEQVVSVAADSELADVVEHNLKLLSIDNVVIVRSTAEEFIANWSGANPDLIYLDPDRRDGDGKKVVVFDDCSPNVNALMPKMLELCPKVIVKCSPLFDVDEAFRLFGDCSVEVISLGGECKEVMIYIDGSMPRLAAEAVGAGRYEVSRDEAMNATFSSQEFIPEEYRYLIIPDVALQKARLTASALQGKADIWNNNSFGFARQRPEGVLGRTEPITRIEEYDSKALRRQLKGKGVDIIMRDFPTSLDEVRRKCSLRSGNTHRIALTRIGGKCYTIWLG